PIAVAERTSVEHAFIGCDMGYEPEAGARVLDIVRATWPRMAGLRVMGSAVLGLAYVACGRLDGYIHPSLYPWDLAGGILLVQEAGGVVTGWEGEPVGISSKRVVAGSKAIQPQLLGLVRGEYQPGLESA
ncbi:MAG: inositol monophosphatase, partial [Chloroflexi bacterium]